MLYRKAILVNIVPNCQAVNEADINKCCSVSNLIDDNLTKAR